MSTLVGERFNDGTVTLSKYIKHPPGSSSFWKDGDALDAGTAQRIDQDVSHLDAESFRHLLFEPGGTALQKITDVSAEWAGTDRQPPPTGTTVDPVRAVPWNVLGGFAWRQGPFFAVVDRDVDGGYSYRAVQIELEINSVAGGSLLLYMAMTTTPEPPSDSYIDGTFFAVSSQAGGGYERIVKVMAPTSPRIAYAGVPRQCRPNTTAVPTCARSVLVPEFYIWLAWASFDTSNVIESVSAFEVPT